MAAVSLATYAAALQSAERTNEPHEIRENVGSIEACPERCLSGDDRILALEWARQGLDVYAYTSGGSIGTWCLWLVNRRIPLGPATECSEGDGE